MIEYNSQEKQDSLSHVRFADEELIKTQVLQGEAAQTIIRGENCSVYKMENETGEGVITRYPVFPGIELLYDDIHMSCGVAHREDPGPTCWRSITVGLAGLSANFQMGVRSIWERVIWPSMS